MTHYEALKQYFGYDSFREGQEELVTSILAGCDTLGIMPTGAGKSVCYQIPALIKSGITLIISPLISLMKDQVNALTQSGVSAAFINSSLNERQISSALVNASNGAYKLIYVAPERLLTTGFLDFAQKVEISMVTVDEAHCISQWGQDFRPSYSKIPEFISRLERRPIVSAFTATATQMVRNDIIDLLKLDTPKVLVTGFDRPNLYFEVRHPHDKYGELLSIIKDKNEKRGIVYCSTRKTVEEVCERLNKDGCSASRYHAGLPDLERQNNQEDFLYDRVQIIVATNAFGMGIDKSDVSFVVHYNMPKDIESYYQEAGRAGRDGEAADCILLFSGQDVHTQQWLIEHSQSVEYSDEKTEARLKELQRRRLREMTFYCTVNDCLRSYILKYFGENPPDFCGNCGNCNSNFDLTDVTVDTKKNISCAVRMNQRYGVNMIIDVLRGSKNERVLKAGLDTLSTYNICEKSDKQLREIINYLILNDYLRKTDEEYPCVKVGSRAEEVLYGGKTVMMKLVRDKERPAKKLIQNLHVADAKLLSALRALRMEIAREQGVPAFLIFSDSTLTDMCMKHPNNEAEMLNVSGVGEVKLHRYGERFLREISKFTLSDTETRPPKFNKSDIKISDESVTISIIADRINCKIILCGYPKISSQRINNWLAENGYMKKITINGKNFKVTTEKGLALGIKTEEANIRGEQAYINSYSRAVQQLIVDKLEDIMTE